MRVYMYVCMVKEWCQLTESEPGDSLASVSPEDIEI